MRKLSVDDVTAMIVGQIGKLAPMNEETADLFQKLAKKMLEQAGNKIKGDTYGDKNFCSRLRTQGNKLEKTISYITNNEDIVCPNLSYILEGKEASYEIYILHL